MIVRRGLLPLLLVFAMIVSGCQGSNIDGFIVLPGARDVKVIEIEKPLQAKKMQYRLQAEFPARKEITKLVNQLKSQGWEALNDDPINPGSISSNARLSSENIGWDEYEDDTQNPPQMVYKWWGFWEHKGKRKILNYHMLCRYPKDGPPNMLDISVNAGLILYSDLERIKKAALEYEKTGNLKL